MKRWFPLFLTEPVAAVAGLVGRLMGKNFASSQAHARGWLIFPTSHRLWIGSRVSFVGIRNIDLGDGVSFYGNTYLNADGADGSIKIGSNTHIDQFCVLYGHGGLRIGSDCAIASGVIIYTQSNQYAHDPRVRIIDQPVVYAPVTIGEDVWIGAGAVILPGIEVGDHAVIGAASLVRKNVPAWAIVGGVPAKVLGNRETSGKLHQAVPN